MQRTNDVLGGLGPDQSSPQSRNMDVAALYFDRLWPMAVTGVFAFGFIAEHLADQCRRKMLVGYPWTDRNLGINSIDQPADV